MAPNKMLPLLAIQLLLPTLLFSLVAPVADAHTCSAPNPASACGSCAGGGAHDHRYSDGRPYCASSPPQHYICIWWNATAPFRALLNIGVSSDLPLETSHSILGPGVLFFERSPIDVQTRWPICVPVPIGPPFSL